MIARRLFAGDVMLEIGGYKVANNGNIRIEGNEIRSVNWPVYVRQLGETVPARVLRDGVEAEVSVPVSKRSWRIRPFLHDRKADWFLVGGLAFTTVSFDWLGQGRSRYREDPGDERKTPGSAWTTTTNGTTTWSSTPHRCARRPRV